jgi:hypothetical protein
MFGIAAACQDDNKMVECALLAGIIQISWHCVFNCRTAMLLFCCKTHQA